MKKQIAWVLTLFLLLGTAGCGNAADESLTTSIPSATSTPAQTQPASTGSKTTLDQQVIYDSEGVTITVTGMEDDWMGTKVKLLLENNTDRNIALSGDVFAVNGITVPGYLYADVAAGMKANDALELYTDALQIAGIDEIATIRSADARLVDTDSFDVFGRVSLDLTTSAGADYVQQIDDNGEVLLQQDGVTVIAQIISEELHGSSVQILVRNETGKDIIVEAENVSVNGYTLDAWLYDTVLADTVRFSRMDLFSAGLEENGIETVEKVSFNLKILNAVSYETIFQSERLEIYVQG